MKTKIISFVAFATVLAGCATTDVEQAEKPVSQKLGVVQVGAQQNTDFVFCDGADCPQRTRKVIPPPPKPAPIVAQKAAELQPIQHKVHFRWGWSRLDKEGLSEIAAIAGLPVLKNAKSIVVAGRTDPTGSKKANEKLALKRAQTVKAALVMAGLPEHLIVTEVQAPCCDGDLKAPQSVMRELRRTDIDITIKK